MNNKIIVGLIAEFNPFHNGHIYIIQEIKKQLQDCFLIVALTQNYTQRGELTVATYEQRKKMALKYGVDKVIPIDIESSIQAAHIFASGAINLLLKENITHLAFGVSDQKADIEIYLNAANKIKSNFDLYNKLVKNNLDQGLAYSKATALALKHLLKTDSYPADILGLEYVKVIVLNNFPIIPFCIKRIVNHKSLKAKTEYASGTQIRKMIDEQKDISKYSPMKIDYPILSIKNQYGLFQNIIFSSTAQELRNIKLIDEGMENLFKKHINLSTYDEFVNACISKRYTKSRIQRVILYTILQIKK